MRFYFDIDETEFQDEYGVNFQDAIFNGVCDVISSQVWSEVSNPDRWHTEVNKKINEILKTKQNEIIESVVDRVAEKVARKKAIIELTPKASEIAAVDKDNVTYFEEMIDRAIAKRFGKN